MMRFLFICLISAGCSSHHGAVKDKDGVFVPDFAPGPHVLVYKTKADYKTKVPVILSEDKSKIVAYPDPSDIKVADGYSMPSVLANNYLLDNRGINQNSAFLVVSYWEYAKLIKVPPLNDLYTMILDKDPFTEICDCGNKRAFTNEQDELNALIKSGKLREKCKVIK